MTDQELDGGRLLSLPPAPDAIELRHLRAFVAVAQELNFGRAATRLYVSQPALSRQIRALERLIGCDLLRRTTHTVELTIAGEALLSRVLPLLTDLDDAVATTRSVGDELTNRMTRLWQPLADHDTVSGLVELRAAYEAMSAVFPIPAGVSVRPVTAGGVPSLVVTPHPDEQPRVLFLHGGGYVNGSAYGYRPLVGAMVTAAGAGALVPDFRLAPEHPYPAAVDDAMAAYQWMLGQGTPPETITIAGDSSGGGLVMSLLLSLNRAGLPQPAGAALLCPGVDLTGDAADRASAGALPEPRCEVIRQVAEAYLAGHPATDPAVAPLLADLSGLPPLLIQAGTGDFARYDAEHLADHAKRHGVDVRLELYPVTAHVFHLFWSFLPEAADALERVGQFIGQVSGAAEQTG